MDPKATIEIYLAAYAADDRPAMSDAAENYNRWVGNGGFPHTLPDGRKVYGLSANFAEGLPAGPVGWPKDTADHFINAGQLAIAFRAPEYRAGQHVRLTSPIDIYPINVWPIGTLGTLTTVDLPTDQSEGSAEGMIVALTLTAHDPDLDEWDNALNWHDERASDSRDWDDFLSCEVEILTADEYREASRALVAVNNPGLWAQDDSLTPGDFDDRARAFVTALCQASAAMSDMDTNWIEVTGAYPEFLPSFDEALSAFREYARQAQERLERATCADCGRVAQSDGACLTCAPSDLDDAIGAALGNADDDAAIRALERALAGYAR